MIDQKNIIEHFHLLTSILKKKKRTIATMESCTGGLVGVLLSDQEGASEVVKGGSFTYSNEEKIACGVPADIIDTYGVYSIETAEAMATACRMKHETDIGIGVTGSIGAVDPNNADSVPGEVFFAIDLQGDVHHRKLNIDTADRMSARLQIADSISKTLIELL